MESSDEQPVSDPLDDLAQIDPVMADLLLALAPVDPAPPPPPPSSDIDVGGGTSGSAPEAPVSSNPEEAEWMTEEIWDPSENWVYSVGPMDGEPGSPRDTIATTDVPEAPNLQDADTIDSGPGPMPDSDAAPQDTAAVEIQDEARWHGGGHGAGGHDPNDGHPGPPDLGRGRSQDEHHGRGHTDADDLE